MQNPDTAEKVNKNLLTEIKKILEDDKISLETPEEEEEPYDSQDEEEDSDNEEDK